MKFMKSYWTDIKTNYVFQQDVRAYAGNFIYVVRLQVDVGDRLDDTFSSVLLYFSEKKPKKIDFVSDGHC